MKVNELAELLDIHSGQLRQVLTNIGIKPQRGQVKLMEVAVALVSAVDLANEPEADLKEEKTRQEIVKLRHQNFAKWLAIEVEAGRRVHVDDVTPLMDMVSRNFRAVADLLARKSLHTGEEVYGVLQGPLTSFRVELDRLFPESGNFDE